jgi:hypothetical protein
MTLNKILEVTTGFKAKYLKFCLVSVKYVVAGLETTLDAGNWQRHLCSHAYKHKVDLLESVAFLSNS